MPHVRVTGTVVLGSIMILGPALLLDARAEQARKTSGPAKPYRDYQVAAGTYISVELLTALSSNTSRPGDPVRARLARAVMLEGVEVLPEGAAVIGTVMGADPAGKKQCGRVAFRFQVIEHPDTGSRATLRTGLLEFYSERPAKGNVFPELRLDKWGEVSISLVAPVTVRIPIRDTAPSTSR
jgi:hypothetical protein